MVKQKALKIIMIISIIGILFSGYLSYQELFTGTCNVDAVNCGIKTNLIGGLPACVYGFFMYLLVFIISLLGLKKQCPKKVI